MNRPLNVNSVIAQTIQGEGPYAGTRATLVRLDGCNLSCQACDEPQTWQPKSLESERLQPEEILDIIRSAGRGKQRIMHVIITGGEPLLQQRTGLRELVEHILMSYRVVHIETNGSIAPDPWLQNLMSQTNSGRLNVVVSPKVSGPLATDVTKRRINASAITMFAARGAIFKFVCSTTADVEAVAEFVDRSAIKRRTVWIMGAGATIEQSNESLAKIATLAVEHGFNLTGRLHLAAWQGGE